MGERCCFLPDVPNRFAKSDKVLKPTNLEDWNSPPTVHGYKGGDQRHNPKPEIQLLPLLKLRFAGYVVSAKNLPSQPTSFIGREHELAEISRLLNEPSCRILTLVGPGGIGKTQLAIETARQFGKPDTTFFLPFQALTSSEFMVSIIGEVIGVQFSPIGEPEEQLLDYLYNKSFLLIADNLEHLVDGAPLLAKIVAHAPEVKIIATSRERLNLREEWVFDVEGLQIPANTNDLDIEHFSAVALFLHHARRMNAKLVFTPTQVEAIIRICRAVDGMPLALELASAWVRTLPVEDIASEIERSLDILTAPARNSEPRHQSIRAAFEPTWNRLSEEERHIFAKLSVFRGGFTREATERVARASLQTLSSLVDKSLVQTDASGRYDVHNLLRQYAEEQLDNTHDEAAHTHDLHCHYYSVFLEQCWERITGSDIKQAFIEIESDLSNIRTAWAWAIHRHRRDDIEKALNCLCFFYDERGRYQEGEQIFARAAAAFEGDSAEAVRMRAKIQLRQGALCHTAESLDKGTALLRDCISTLRQYDLQAELAFGLRRLALNLSDNKLALSEVKVCLDESFTIFSKLGLGWEIAHALHWLSIYYLREYEIHRLPNMLELGEEYARKSLSHYQKLDNHWGIATVSLNLSDVAAFRDDYNLCRQYVEKALVFCQEIGSFWGTSSALWQLGTLAYEQRDYVRARRYVAQGLQTSLDYGVARINFYLLNQQQLAVRILLEQGELQKAYELIGMLSKQRQKAALSQQNHEAFTLFDQLEQSVPPHLLAAFQHGQDHDADITTQNIITYFSDDEAQATELPEPLTAREGEVLRLLAAGLSNPEIAQRLVISAGTVKAHSSRIYAKLGVHNRVQAVSEANRLGLL